MFCCVCEGMCMHVGPHSFCEAHGGKRDYIVITAPDTNPKRMEPV